MLRARAEGRRICNERKDSVDGECKVHAASLIGKGSTHWDTKLRIRPQQYSGFRGIQVKADSTEEQKDHQVVRQYLLQPSGWKGFLPLKKMACLAILVPPMLSRSCASSSLRQCIFIVATPLTMSSRPIPSSTHSAFCPLKKIIRSCLFVLFTYLFKLKPDRIPWRGQMGTESQP